MAPPPIPTVPLTPSEAKDRRNPARSEPELAATERKALGVCALLAAVVVAWIAMPVGVGILLGMLMAFTMQPVYEWLRARTGKSLLSSLLTVTAATLGILATVGVLALLFVTRGATLARSLVAAIAPDSTLSGVAQRFDPWLAPVHLSSAELAKKAQAGASEIATRMASIAEVVASQTAAALLALFFAILTMHFCLRHWRLITRTAQETLPLRPDYTRAIFESFRRAGRSTLFGTVVTGLVQGLLATIGYWIVGLPEPLFFGAATAVASLLPAVGTLLVWVPVGIVLIATGHPGRGIVELAWGLLIIVGVTDYVIRPALVGGEEELPAVVTFAALFGGVEVFGLKGLILGPLFMSLALAVLRIYAAEMAQRRARAQPADA